MTVKRGYVLVRNPEEAKRDAARREVHLERLRAELARLKELDGDAHKTLHLIEYRLDAGKLSQRTELTEEHRAIVSVLKIEEPQQIWDISLLLSLKSVGTTRSYPQPPHPLS